MATSPTLRRGQESDLPRVLALIQELAAYEREPDAVTNTLDMMRHDGFGPTPIFGFLCLKAVMTLSGWPSFTLLTPLGRAGCFTSKTW